MKVDINKIKVNERIRKEYGDMISLERDISKRGLISPIAVSPDMELLAGERRLRAAKNIGMKEIEVNVMSVDDALSKLMVEISENENRKQFTFSEKLRWAELLKKEYEREDAKEDSKKVNDEIAKRVGIGSREKLRKCTFIKKNADADMIRALDDDQLSVNAAYVKLKEEKERLAKANRLLEKHESQASKQIDKLDLKVRELKEEINSRDVTDKDRTICELRKALKKAHEDITVISKGRDDAENALKAIQDETHVCPEKSGILETLSYVQSTLEPVMSLSKTSALDLDPMCRYQILTKIRDMRQDLQDLEDMIAEVCNG